jgi:hypothetical protein
MDKAELTKFLHVIEYLDTAEGMLTNFKGRGGKAAAQAAARYKQQGKTIPSWKPMAEALVKLTKAVATASKAVNDIHKIAAVAADKKKGAELTLADAKKQVRDLLPRIQPVDDIVASISGLTEKIYKELGLNTMGLDVDLAVITEKYCPFFTKYYADFKIELNKLK